MQMLLQQNCAINSRSGCLLSLQRINRCPILAPLIPPTIWEHLSDVCKCEGLVWLALSFLHHRISPVVHLGLTGVDWVQVLLDCRCHLKIAFIPPWNTRTDKKQIFFLMIQSTLIHTNTSFSFLYTSLSGRHTHTPRNMLQIVFASSKANPLKKEKDVEWD